MLNEYDDLDDAPSWREAYDARDLIDFLHTFARTMDEQHAHQIAASLVVCAQYIEGRRHGQAAVHAEFLRELARSMADRDGVTAYLMCDRLYASAECIEDFADEVAA